MRPPRRGAGRLIVRTDGPPPARGRETAGVGVGAGDSGGWTPHLDPGERLLWEGRPDERLFLFERRDIFGVPFSLLWGGGVFFWLATAIGSGAPLSLVIWGSPLVAFGAYMIVGRFFVDAWIRRRTRYAITDRRALIARDAFGRSMREMPLRPGLEVELREGGLDSVRLGPAPATFGESGRGDWLGDDGSFTLRGLADGERVHAVIRSVLRDGGGDGPRREP